MAYITEEDCMTSACFCLVLGIVCCKSSLARGDRRSHVRTKNRSSRRFISVRRTVPIRADLGKFFKKSPLFFGVHQKRKFSLDKVGKLDALEPHGVHRGSFSFLFFSLQLFIQFNFFTEEH